MAASLAAAKEIGLEAAVAAVVSQVEGVFHIKTITNKCFFLGWQHVAVWLILPLEVLATALN